MGHALIQFSKFVSQAIQVGSNGGETDAKKVKLARRHALAMLSAGLFGVGTVRKVATGHNSTLSPSPRLSGSDPMLQSYARCIGLTSIKRAQPGHHIVMLMIAALRRKGGSALPFFMMATTRQLNQNLNRSLLHNLLIRLVDSSNLFSSDGDELVGQTARKYLVGMVLGDEISPMVLQLLIGDGRLDA